MPTPIETVTAFCAEWGKGPDALRAAIRDWFTADTVWENVGYAMTTGPDEAITLLQGFEAQAGVVAIVVDMLAIVADGGRVLTERIDRLIDAAGNEIKALRLMGIFEVADGKITAWRDYFDTVALASPAG